MLLIGPLSPYCLTNLGIFGYEWPASQDNLTAVSGEVGGKTLHAPATWSFQQGANTLQELLLLVADTMKMCFLEDGWQTNDAVLVKNVRRKDNSYWTDSVKFKLVPRGGPFSASDVQCFRGPLARP